MNEKEAKKEKDVAKKTKKEEDSPPAKHKSKSKKQPMPNKFVYEADDKLIFYDENGKEFDPEERIREAEKAKSAPKKDKKKKASECEDATLREGVARIARENPEFRKILVPILRANNSPDED